MYRATQTVYKRRLQNAKQAAFPDGSLFCVYMLARAFLQNFKTKMQV